MAQGGLGGIKSFLLSKSVLGERFRDDQLLGTERSVNICCCFIKKNDFFFFPPNCTDMLHRCGGADEDLEWGKRKISAPALLAAPLGALLVGLLVDMGIWQAMNSHLL